MRNEQEIKEKIKELYKDIFERCIPEQLGFQALEQSKRIDALEWVLNEQEEHHELD